MLKDQRAAQAVRAMMEGMLLLLAHVPVDGQGKLAYVRAGLEDGIDFVDEELAEMRARDEPHGE